MFLLFLFSLRIQFTTPDAATLVLAFMHCFNLLISCLRNWLNLKTHIQVVLTVWCFIKIVTINHVHSFSFKHKQGLQHQQRDPPPHQIYIPHPYYTLYTHLPPTGSIKSLLHIRHLWNSVRNYQGWIRCGLFRDNLQILISSGLDHVKSYQAVTAGDTRG